MGELKSFLESFKEFIWDIIGYLLPGSFCLILLAFTVDNNYWLNHNSLEVSNNCFAWILIIVSYLLGYVIYSLNTLIDNFLGEKSYSKKIAKKIENRSVYKVGKKILEETFDKQGIKEELADASIRDLRSIAMGLCPEQDQKVYTFQFRADISNSTGIISLIIGTVGLLCKISQLLTCINLDFMITDTTHVWLYIFLIIVFFLLKSMRNKFYAISLSLPFSLLSSKLIHEKTETKDGSK